MDGGKITVRAILDTAKFESGVRNVRSELGAVGSAGEEGFGRVDAAVGKSNDGFTVAKGVLANLATQGIGMATSALTGFVKESINVGASFESSMSNVAALSGATGDQLKALEDKASELGATTTFTASQAADALGYMALAGWDTEQMLASVGDVLTLAQAGQMDLAAASDLVTDYLSAFNMEASEAKRMSDVLAYAQANANTTVEGLGMAFKNCAANCNAAGMDVETTSAAISMMANQGLKGSEAGTALTAVMRDMTAKMEDGAIKIGDTAVAVTDAEGNYRDFAEILADVGAATDGMGEADRAVALQSTFTADSVKGMNLLLNAGADQLSSFRDELYGSAGAAEELAGTMTDNLQGDMAAMGSAFEALQKDVYERLKEPLREAVKVLTETAIPAVRDFLGNIEQTGPIMAGAAGGIAVFAAAAKMKGVASYIGGVASSIGGVTGAVKLLGGAFKTCLPLAILTAAGAAVGAVAGKVAEYREKAEKATKAARAYRDASADMFSAISSESGAWADAKGFGDDYKGTLDDLKKSVQEAVEGNAALADSVSGIFSSAGSDIGSLQGYSNTIEELAGRSDLSKEQVAKLEIAIENVNKAMGTSYELAQDEGGAYQIYADGAMVAKDAVLELIDAQQLQIMKTANADAYAEAYRQHAENLKKQADAQMAVNDAERNGGEASDELKNALHEANAAVEQSKNLMDACADSETLYQMALDASEDSIVRAAAEHIGLQAAMQASGKSSLDLVSDLENVGASAEGLAGLSNEACAQLAGAYDGTFTSIAGILEANGVAVEESWATGQRALEGLGASWQDMGDISCEQLEAVMSQLVRFSDESGNSFESVGMSATELATLSADELAGLGATFDTSLSGLVTACSEAGVELPAALRDSLLSDMTMDEAVAFFVEQGEAIPEGFAASFAEGTGKSETEVQSFIDALVVELSDGDLEEAAKILGHQVPEGLAAALEEAGGDAGFALSLYKQSLIEDLESWNLADAGKPVGVSYGYGVAQGIEAGEEHVSTACRAYTETIEKALDKKVSQGLGAGSMEGIVEAVLEGAGPVAEAVSSACDDAKRSATSGMSMVESEFHASVSRIQALFSGTTLRFPSVQVPELSVSPSGWSGDDYMKGVVPTFSASLKTIPLCANGGIFDKATIIGIGEAGPEAAVPLLGNRMRPFAEAVAKEMGGTGGTTNYTINGNVVLDATKIKSAKGRQEVLEIVFDAFNMAGAGA